MLFRRNKIRQEKGSTSTADQEPVLTTAAEEAFFDKSNDSDFEEEASESSEEEDKESEAEADKEASVSVPVATEQANLKMPAKKPAAFEKSSSSVDELSNQLAR